MSGAPSGVARMHAANAGTTISDAATLVAEPPETVLEAAESVDALTAREIKKLLRRQGIDRDKVAICKVAVAYLAVKNKIGSPFGGGLDDETE